SVLFLALCGCLTREGYLDGYASDAVFPKSSELLKRPDLRGLTYYKLTEAMQDPSQSGIVYETWGDQRFIANVNVSLRYRHRVRTSGNAGDEQYFPVAASLDLRCPLDGPRRQVALSWLSGLEQHLRIRLDDLSTTLDQLAGCEVSASRVFPYEKVVGEVSVNELPQRGLFLSIDMYEKSFYEQSIQLAPKPNGHLP
ncbi:MAG: hypothetical protein ACRD2L_12420, partial [Terriglobia bacterium]